MSISQAQTIDPVAGLPDVPLRRTAGARNRVMAHALAADVARVHGETLLHTALRWSFNRDDAHDAYQRAMELLLAHADRIDRSKALSWMQVVVRREAGVLRRQHDRTVALDGEDVDQAVSRLSRAPEEHVDAIDLAQRAGEALATLKESEAQALCLRAQGMSYEEIADLYGWSYTKVNRAVTEGRKAFVDHYQAVESGVVCSDTSELLARYVAGELKARVAIKVRTHLIRCSGCRALLHAERGADHALRALLPPVFVVAATSRKTGAYGWMHEHLLGPIGHIAGRLTPAADHLTSAKLGVVAASVLAVAGSSAAVRHEVRHREPTRVLHTSLVSSDRHATARSSNGSARVIDRAINRAVTLRKQSDARATSKARAHASAVKHQVAAKAHRVAKAQRAAKARRAANAHEFSSSAGEFASTTKHSIARAQKAAADPASSAVAPATAIDVGGGAGDSSVTVSPEPSPSTGTSSDTISDEFGN